MHAMISGGRVAMSERERVMSERGCGDGGGDGLNAMGAMENGGGPIRDVLGNESRKTVTRNEQRVEQNKKKKEMLMRMK